LKPDAFPVDGGQAGLAVSAHKIADTLPCENDQAKPDRISRLARSTILSKILESTPPERRPFGSRPKQHRLGCPRTCCARRFLRLTALTGAFCANLLKVSNFAFPVKPDLLRPRAAPTTMLAVIPRPRKPARRQAPYKSYAQRKISKIDQRNRPSLWGSRELNSRVLQWFCSLWDSLQGLRGRLPYLTQRTSSPLPFSGRPHGHREAPLLTCNFQRVAQVTPRCKRRNPP